MESVGVLLGWHACLLAGIGWLAYFFALFATASIVRGRNIAKRYEAGSFATTLLQSKPAAKKRTTRQLGRLPDLVVWKQVRPL
jgi:hypothetical protein